MVAAGLNLSAACHTLPEPGDDTMRFHRAAMSCVCGVVTTAHFPERHEHRLCVHSWHTHHYFNYFSMDVVFKRIGLLLFYRITFCMAFQLRAFFCFNRTCNKRSCIMYKTRLLNWNSVRPSFLESFSRRESLWKWSKLLMALDPTTTTFVVWRDNKPRSHFTSANICQGRTEP